MRPESVAPGDAIRGRGRDGATAHTNTVAGGVTPDRSLRL